MVAFGPFAEEAEVDFLSATDHPLFGMYGATGSGKTSILDGITYALFGESSGAQRRTEDLRSHFVGPEQETVVELLFETGGERYFIRRSPKQEVEKQRGEGTTERQAEAYLFNATGIDPGELRFPDRCGRTIVEKKVGAVSERVEGIVGFKVQQFRQVVLLPQGRFRELLTAGSSERSEILRRLFDTEVYERVTEILKGRRVALSSERARLTTELDTLISGTRLESPEALGLAVSELEGEVRSLEERLEKERGRERELREALDAAREAHRAYRELSDARSALTAVEALESERLVEELNRAQAAAAGEPAYRAVVGERREVGELTAKIGEAEGALKEASDRLESARESVRAAQARAGEQERLRRELSRIEGWQEELEAVREETRELPERQERLKELESRSAHLEEELRGAQERLEELGHALEASGATRERITAAEAQLAELQRRGSLITRYLGSSEALRREEEKLAEASRAQESLKDRHAEAEERVRQAEARRLQADAQVLASSLEAGTPCPVCGSTEHPRPAEAGEITGPTPAEAAQEERTLRTELAEVERELSVLGERVRLEKQRCEELTAELGGAPDTGADAEVEEAAAARIAEIEGLRKSVTAEEELRALREESRSRREQLRQELETLKPRTDREREAVNAMRGRLEHSRVPDELSKPGALEGRLKALTTELDGEVEAARRAAQELTLAQEAQQRQRLELDSLAQRLEAAEGRLEAAQGAFETAMKRGGFGGEEDFDEARRSEERIGELGRMIEEHRERAAAARERLVRAQQAVEKLEEPQLEAAREAVEAASRRVSATLEELSAKRERLNHLEEARLQIGRRREALEAVEDEHRMVAELSSAAEGDNQARVRLVDYVLSVHFEEVLAQANSRLFTMSNRRYTLLRKDSGSGRAHRGLEIEVYDAHTDRSRDAKTLSGGEGFLASLALALGLSDTVQSQLGGLNLEVIFIDEGFGHLDEEALEEALNILGELTGSGRSVGIISHVEEVKRRVPAGFLVESTLRGSRITPRLGGPG